MKESLLPKRIFEIDQKINDLYEIESFLGEGAFAEVYRVRHRFLGRQAMKVFKRTNTSQAETIEILHEAILLSRLGHTNIIRVFNADIFETTLGSRGFFTMEYVAGGTLDRYWRSFGKQLVPLEQTIEIISQICQGLNVAHSTSPPIIHRDIKPQNILVGYDKNGLYLKLSDFGLAKNVNPLTLLASARGTLAYKAPEFLDKFDSTRTDIWAVGMIMYLLLTDHLPYDDLSDMDFGRGYHWRHPIPPPRSLNIDIPASLEVITMRALSVNPEERYFDARELLLDLQSWVKSRKGQKTAVQGSEEISSIHNSSPHAKIKEAFKISSEPGRLMEAADLMEEALNADPEYRKQYEYQLILWRKGISM